MGVHNSDAMLHQASSPSEFNRTSLESSRDWLSWQQFWEGGEIEKQSGKSIFRKKRFFEKSRYLKKKVKSGEKVAT